MDAPAYIAQDTYAGKYVICGPCKPFRVTTWLASELASLASTGVIFESFGHRNGREMFGRTRYVADSAGNLHCYDSDGVKKIVHPAGRRLRIVTR